MPGRLEVICGPMFAGKTTELVRRLLDAQRRGEPVVAVKPARDIRYRVLEIATHTGETFPATPVGDADGVVPAAQNAAVLAIDEVHFFGQALTQVCRDLIRRGVRVIVAGVERDHLGRPFEPFPGLLCEADEVVKLSGKCAVCGGPSVHSQRMFASDAAIVVGGAESYQPRCRACFNPDQSRAAQAAS
jgi:thymidine kinase